MDAGSGQLSSPLHSTRTSRKIQDLEAKVGQLQKELHAERARGRQPSPTPPSIGAGDAEKEIFVTYGKLSTLRATWDRTREQDQREIEKLRRDIDELQQKLQERQSQVEAIQAGLDQAEAHFRAQSQALTSSLTQKLAETLQPRQQSPSEHSETVNNTTSPNQGLLVDSLDPAPCLQDVPPKIAAPVSRKRKLSDQHDNKAKRKSTSGKRSAFEGLTNAEPGELYIGYWQASEAWYALLVLPLGSFKTLAIQGSIKDSALANGHIPVCYQRQEGGTLSWAEGYEDNGTKIQKRKFPVMWFVDNQDVSTNANGEFAIPPDTLSWLPADRLRPFDTHGPDGMSVSGREPATKFAERLKTRREAAAMRGLPHEFHLVSFSSKNRRFSCGGEEPPLRLHVDTDLGVAKTGQDAALDLTIDPQRIKGISSYTDNATTRLDLQLTSSGSGHGPIGKSELVFQTIADDSGLSVSSESQAAGFCQWARTVHPGIAWEDVSGPANVLSAPAVMASAGSSSSH